MNRAVVETALEALRQLTRKPQADGTSGQAEAPQAEGPGDPVAPCGSHHCAGCYSIGEVEGRERLIHPPKASREWEEWLRKWPAKGKAQ